MALQIKNIIPEDTKKIIYTAIVQSRLQYGITSWGATYKSNLISLENAQKKFIKILYCKPKRYGSQELFKNTSILTLNQLHKISALKYIKKHQIINRIGHPEKLTRNNSTIIPPPKIMTNIGKTNVTYQGIQYFNKLNKENRQALITANQKNYKKIVRKIVTLEA